LGRIPDEIIQKVRDHVDVVELVGRSVSLKRAGRSYKGLCPFHDEKTPSFNVNPDRQSFYCFGCHEGGDAFAFLMKSENLTFIEAVRSLAKDCGIEVPESGGRGPGSGLSEKLYETNAAMLALYQRELEKPGCPGAAYLRERGFDAELCRRFKIGFAPEAWDTAVSELRRLSIPAEIGEKAGLLARRQSGGHYDRLRGRVIFPIEDVRGRVIGFGGRAIAKEQEPKYLNTPETPVFHKREALYGFPAANEPIRRSGRAIVVEGYFDQIALCRAGLGEALATCGTSLTPDHARGLRRRTQSVVLLFDGDAAGERAMLRAMEVLLPSGLRVRAAMLPAGQDPDDLLESAGADALRRLVDEAPAALDVAIERAVAAGIDTPWAKADAVANVAPLLALVGSAIERSEYCARLALAVGTAARHVEAAVAAAVRGEDARDAVPVAVRRGGPEERNLRQLARSLVEHPALGARVPADELDVLVGSGPLRELIGVLVEAAGEDRAVDLEELAMRLPDEARGLLHELAIDSAVLEEEAAARTVDDTLRWLREQQLRRREKEITARLRNPSMGEDEKRALLEERQHLLAQRRRFSQRSPEVNAPAGPPA
jgi:DNA primase